MTLDELAQMVGVSKYFCYVATMDKLYTKFAVFSSESQITETLWSHKLSEIRSTLKAINCKLIVSLFLEIPLHSLYNDLLVVTGNSIQGISGTNSLMTSLHHRLLSKNSMRSAKRSSNSVSQLPHPLNFCSELIT